MDRDAFVSCFAAVALALLVFYVAIQFTTDLIAAVILMLIAAILALVTGNGGSLRLGPSKRRRR
jgi:uncharacterized membrane protein YjjP (DUF1212 family)